MATTAQHEDPFVFIVKLQPIRRIIAITAAAFFLLLPIFMPVKMGLKPFVHSLSADPGVWMVITPMFAVPAIFFLWLAFPPNALLPRLEIWHNAVRFTPARFERRLLGEPIVNAAITPQSREILVCKNFLGKVPDGWSVIIRGAAEGDRVIKARTLALRTADEGQEIVNGITVATGLPVHLIQRPPATDGTIQETPWTPSAVQTKAPIVGLVVSTLPWVGGMIVGHLMPRVIIIVAIGLGLWLTAMIAVWTIAHRSRERTQNLALLMLTTLFTFAASYAAAFALGAFLFRPH